MSDPTEAIRKELVVQINAEPGSREALEAEHGEVLTTTELQDRYEVKSFAFGMVIVRRRSDDVTGVMDFTHSPRFYFGFTPAAI